MWMFGLFVTLFIYSSIQSLGKIYTLQILFYTPCTILADRAPACVDFETSNVPLITPLIAGISVLKSRKQSHGAQVFIWRSCRRPRHKCIAVPYTEKRNIWLLVRYQCPTNICVLRSRLLPIHNPFIRNQFDFVSREYKKCCQCKKIKETSDTRVYISLRPSCFNLWIPQNTRDFHHLLEFSNSTVLFQVLPS